MASIPVLYGSDPHAEAVGVPRKETRIFLIEPPAENWGVGGGLLALEVDMGFKIDV